MYEDNYYLSPSFTYFITVSFFVYCHKYIYKFGFQILSYYILHNKLIYADTELNNLIENLTHSKRSHIVKDIWKSFILACIFIFTTPILLDGIFNNIWSNYYLWTINILFSSLHISEIIYIDNLPIKNIFYYTIIFIISYFNTITYYNINGYYHSFLFLGYFYSASFFTTFFLSIQSFIHDTKFKNKLCNISYIIYFTCILFNFITQLFIFYYNDFSFYIFIYITNYLLILYHNLQILHLLTNNNTYNIFNQSNYFITILIHFFTPFINIKNNIKND